MVSFRKPERPVSHNVALTTFFRKTPAYHSKSNKTKLQKERKTPAYQGRKTVNRAPESINREIRQNASRTQDPTTDNQPWTARTKTSKQQQQGLGKVAAATKRPKQGQNGQNPPKTATAQTGKSWTNSSNTKHPRQGQKGQNYPQRTETRT
ncbi:hypothetical protein LXL04_003630 [Taraxacum kok-saghyz]